jgi:hypothetical protein
MSSRYAILRIAKLKTMGNVAGSLAHTYRTRDTPNADPEKTAANEHSLATCAEVLEAFKKRLPEKHRKDAVLGIEYFVGASPEWFGDSQDGSAYFLAAVDWLQKRHGRENVVSWSIHRDESTPHLVAYVVPLDDSGRLNAKKWTGGKVALSDMQSEFAREVGQRFGLWRGIEGSRAHHQTIKDWYAQVEQPSQHVTIRPETIQPKVLRKGLFRTEYESPEMVAERLTQAVRRAYAPAVEAAKLAASERRRAAEMAETAQGKGQALKIAQERLQALEKAFRPVVELAGLDRDRFGALMQAAAAQVAQLKREQAELEQAKQWDQERRRRTDDLVRVEQKTSGTSRTLARHGLEAIKQAGGNARQVDWAKVEQSAALESMQEHRHSPKAVLAAIVKYSPGMVEPARQEAAREMVSRLAATEIKAPMRSRNRGLDMSR